jgi:hypothetical protein
VLGDRRLDLLQALGDALLCFATLIGGRHATTLAG